MSPLQLGRAAIAIHEQLTYPKPPAVSLDDAAWEQCRRLTRQHTLAVQRGWFGAASRIREQLEQRTSSLRDHLGNTLASLTAGPPRIPTPRELYDDLSALTTEFPHVNCQCSRHMVVVKTSAITFADIELGEFEIRLRINDLTHRFCYDIEACRPNPSSEHAGTIHPHVQNNTLCEGDGRTAIRAALTEGRLFDFFTIVNSILHTYNPASAYTQMDDWDGVSCSDCGRMVQIDDQSCCEACGATHCTDCTTTCTDCPDRYCYECTTDCAACDKPTCSACLQKCRACLAMCCEGCLNNHNLCEECIEQETENTDEAKEEEEPDKRPPATDAAVHAVLVEQTSVPT